MEAGDVCCFRVVMDIIPCGNARILAFFAEFARGVYFLFIYLFFSIISNSNIIQYYKVSFAESILYYTILYMRIILFAGEPLSHCIK